jgi:UDP-N-acetylmuramate dehydrogenase
LIINIRNAKLPNPEKIGSAGSFFMNPIVDKEVYQALSKQYPNMPHYPAPNGVKLSAGWLIDKAGWKGIKIGHSGVYEKQALVLVNHGGATGREIVELAKSIQKDIHEKFGINIYPEVIYL